VKSTESRSKTFRWTDPRSNKPNLREFSGLEYMQGLRDGTIPAPPMAVLINATITRAEPGTVELSCAPGEEHFNPLGTIHGGLACTLLDTAAGCSAHTTLGPGVGYTSIEIKVNYLSAITLKTGIVTATGTVTKAGSRVIFADAAIWDANGQMLASASSSLLVLDRRV
jgi:uncharacterized protein (TIGR00369 family)